MMNLFCGNIIIRWLSVLWRELTQKALEQSSGKLETAFFESLYRITYASGLSVFEHHCIPYRVYSWCVKLLIIAFLFSELWYLFEVSSTLDAVIDNINVTIIHLIVLYRYKCMMDSKNIYNQLSKAMNSPFFDVSSAGSQKVLVLWQNKNNRYFTLLLSLASFTLSIWYIYPLIDDMDYNLVATVRLPVNYKTPERYVIAYILVLIAFHFISFFVIVNDLMMQTFLIHLLCQFSILAHGFENVIRDCKKDFQDVSNIELFLNASFRYKFQQRLRELVEQHKFILKNSSELRRILSRPMLGQLAASGMLICLAGYQVTATVTVSIAKFSMSLLYLTYNLYGYYIMCRWCDEIKMQSENIREAVYFSGWESGVSAVPGAKVRLMLVMARASRPVVLTAGGLYDVSLMSYTTLVKTSYSALTLLLRMRQR